jgi:hypothetical protein
MIDWQQIAANIKSAGVPLERASRELGRPEHYLRSVRSKRTLPRFEDGAKLLNYHLRLCGRDLHRAAMKGNRT